MKSQTFDTFMATVGVVPGEYKQAFDEARRAGHPAFSDYLDAAGTAEDLETYRLDHLEAFWTDQSQQALVEHLARWLTEADSFGDTSKKWDVLRRRFSYPPELAALAERSFRTRGRAELVDVRLDNALLILRSVNAHEAAEFASAVAKKLYKTPSIHARNRQS
ncbi:hypothetical protein [Amycolatopsis keratiniphila]|uniref:hypothetical protein n=1 Tax=Amycolatopsis keratiniphila TaxID=129921 RepID=UPI00087AD549|nr:hypothetical protein [Amycolatopsis keratiniphila]OLZ50326.1 hypothetical protein BS330_29145 [Amycolatopsis keratiniphila subsp. nogabecina]SDU67356.1 hypothetical protein SAMN04489733_8109 [Amycolatopsis keratiniphila]